MQTLHTTRSFATPPSLARCINSTPTGTQSINQLTPATPSHLRSANVAPSSAASRCESARLKSTSSSLSPTVTLSFCVHRPRPNNMSSLLNTASFHPACLPLPPPQATTLHPPPPPAAHRRPDYSLVHPATTALQAGGDDEPTSPSVSVRWQEASVSVSHAASTAPGTPLSSYSSSPVQSVPASPTHTATMVPNLSHPSAARH